MAAHHPTSEADEPADGIVRIPLPQQWADMGRHDYSGKYDKRFFAVSVDVDEAAEKMTVRYVSPDFFLIEHDFDLVTDKNGDWVPGIVDRRGPEKFPASITVNAFGRFERGPTQEEVDRITDLYARARRRPDTDT